MQRDAIRYFESVNVDPLKQTAAVAESKTISIGTLALKVVSLCWHMCGVYPSLNMSNRSGSFTLQPVLIL